MLLIFFQKENYMHEHLKYNNNSVIINRYYSCDLSAYFGLYFDMNNFVMMYTYYVMLNVWLLGL